MTGKLDGALFAKEVVIVCGPGGVGKTTLAAALGIGAACRYEQRVLVVTVDPARRLIDALSIAESGNEVVRLDAERFSPEGPPKGELYVAMVDAKASWDALVRRYSKNASSAQQVLDNPIYQAFSARFSLSHEYAAMERVYELQKSGAYDLLIVDTPPSKVALDFLDAPRRMGEFFSSRLLWWLTVPARSRIASAAARPFLYLAGRVLGGAFLRDVAQFFFALRAMYDGFVLRSGAVGEILSSHSTAFVVATALEDVPMSEAHRLSKELRMRELDPALVVVNRVLPTGFTSDEAAQLARRLTDVRSPSIAARDLDIVRAVGANYLELRERAVRERRMLEQARQLAGACVTATYRPDDVGGLEGLVALSKELFESLEH